MSTLKVFADRVSATGAGSCVRPISLTFFARVSKFSFSMSFETVTGRETDSCLSVAFSAWFYTR